jgi:hypothetical protein
MRITHHPAMAAALTFFSNGSFIMADLLFLLAGDLHLFLAELESSLT